MAGECSKDPNVFIFQDNSSTGLKQRIAAIAQKCGAGPSVSDAPSHSHDDELAKVMKTVHERPAAMVSQSAFVKKLDHQVKHELARIGCSAPVVDPSWLYGDIIAINKHEDVSHSVQANQDDGEEKINGRLQVYRRAFSALILHFDALNPLLREIKMSYDDLVFTKEEQLREANIIRRSIDHLQKDLDIRLNNLHFEGIKQLNDTEKQCYALMRYVDRQDAAIHTMTDILNRLENSLSEEHDLRRDSEDQKTLLMIEIDELREKLGMPPRSIAAEESYVPVEEEEVEQEEHLIDKEDPMILNASLDSTTKTLDEIEEKIAALEEEYKDVTPRSDLNDLKILMEVTREDNKMCLEMFEQTTFQLNQYEDEIIQLQTELALLEEAEDELNEKK